ncbi:MAG: hypothetical protein IJW72_00150 [Alphaproteobacteria bacterium]|jgi:hypothetical protein|nr:hypothetical protein [Alphaproteobacteria bacterium]DAN19423.1 MAG TPA: hypothetical protein [Caudoviricetes sp.]
MDQSRLEKYLKVIEANKKEEETQERSVYLPDLKENFTFRTLTRAEKRRLNFGLKFEMKCMADVFNNQVVKQTIYECCGLAPLATKAKEQKLISNYYQILDTLFSSDDLIVLWAAIVQENKIGEAQEVAEEVDDLKN